MINYFNWSLVPFSTYTVDTCFVLKKTIFFTIFYKIIQFSICKVVQHIKPNEEDF